MCPDSSQKNSTNVPGLKNPLPRRVKKSLCTTCTLLVLPARLRARGAAGMTRRERTVAVTP